MDAIDLQRKAKDDALKEVLVFNPLPNDFDFTYGGVTETFHARENKSFKKAKGLFVAELLIEQYVSSKPKMFDREIARKLVLSD